MENRIEAAIAATLAHWDKTPFIWGESDCVLSVCPYVKALTGIDPSDGFTFSYGTPIGAARFINRHGGFLALVRRAMGRAGIAEIRPEQAVKGDVVVVVEGNGFSTGIHLGGLMAFRGIDERVLTRREIIGAWRCV